MEESPLPPSEEQNLGMECYLTDTKPLLGKLKKHPEDFIVNEISSPPPIDPEGEYVIARIKVYNWETNRLIRALSKKLGLSRMRIGFAGTKDKRALTTQLFSFRMPENRLNLLDLKDVYILESYRSNKALELGDLQGNNFRIRIRDLSHSKSEASEIMKKTLDQLSDIGGYPNYFGVQRFGTMRPVTHVVGQQIISRRFKDAVMTYVGNPYENEADESRNARIRLERDLDFHEALDYYPQFYMFERSMIYHLSRNEGDWEGAIDQLPLNLKMMFVHAYQSYLFNQILSQRILKGFSINEPVVGDLVLPLNKHRLPDHHTYISVNKGNLSEMTDLVKKNKAFISGLIFGTESTFAKSDIGDIETKIIDREGIGEDDFVIGEIKGISSRGMRRELKSTVFNLKWRTTHDSSTRLTRDGRVKTEVEVDFSLFRGCYATTFLREIMKGAIRNY